jgi:hypothetical protein
MKLSYSSKSRRSSKSEVLSCKLWKTNVHYHDHKNFKFSYLFFNSRLTKAEYTHVKQNSYAMHVYPKNLLTLAGTLKPSTRLTS